MLKSSTKLDVIIGIVCLMFVYLVLERPSIHRITELLKTDKLKAIDAFVDSMDTELREIFDEEIEWHKQFYKDAISTKTINVNDINRFGHYYRVSLSRFNQAEVYATSLPSKKYYWNNNASENMTEDAIAKFTANGGKMSRIFFLDKTEDLDSPEVIEILTYQKEKMGVKVATVLMSEVPQKYRNNFFVAFVKSTYRFAWFASANHKGEICDFKFTSSEPQVIDYIRAYKEMATLPSFRQY